MKFIRYCLRPALWLVLGGLVGLPMFGQAQGLTVTPAVPEAFQPFAIEWYECSISDNLSEIEVNISVEARTILVNMLRPELCEGAPLVNKKVANIPGLPGDDHPWQILAPSGEWDGFGYPLPPVEVGSVTVSRTPYIPNSLVIWEFRNRTTLHYFLTADYDEKESLMRGGGGGGWYGTGGFNTWLVEGPAPAAAKPVCRFYSAAVNSHFYTAGPGECEMLKQPGSGWTYEGIAFRALVPIKGTCYPGTRPVFRLYNDRAAQNDSNHRFVTNADTYRHMIANGWIGEGVAFCSPED